MKRHCKANNKLAGSFRAVSLSGVKREGGHLSWVRYQYCLRRGVLCLVVLCLVVMRLIVLCLVMLCLAMLYLVMLSLVVKYVSWFSLVSCGLLHRIYST